MTEKPAFRLVDEFHAHDEVLRTTVHEIQKELAVQDGNRAEQAARFDQQNKGQ